MTDFGEPARTSHISKMVLSIVKFGGPSGIRTQDRRIKSQWLKLQDSTKNARNCTKNARKRTKLQVSAGNSRDKRRSQATSQIQSMTNMTFLGGCKLRSQAKTVHVC